MKVFFKGLRVKASFADIVASPEDYEFHLTETEQDKLCTLCEANALQPITSQRLRDQTPLHTLTRALLHLLSNGYERYLRDLPERRWLLYFHKEIV